MTTLYISNVLEEASKEAACFNLIEYTLLLELYWSSTNPLMLSQETKSPCHVMMSAEVDSTRLSGAARGAWIKHIIARRQRLCKRR